MNIEDSLEYDVLTCFWHSDGPLSVNELYQLLEEKGVEVPLSVLKNVIVYLERVQLLKSESKMEWGKRYQPAISLIKFHFNPWGYFCQMISKNNTIVIRRPPLVKSLLITIQYLVKRKFNPC